MNFNVDDYDARVSISSLYHLVQKMRKGALSEELIGAAFRHADAGFDRHMQNVIGAREDLQHMYDWGLIGVGKGKLWKTIMEGRGKSREVMFVYLPSVRKVPHGELEGVLRTRHTFRDKAEVFEEARAVEISPKFAKFLVYINHHAGMGYTEGSGIHFTDSGSGDDGDEGSGITFSQRTSVIERAGGGKYYRKFHAEFLMYWTNPDLKALENELKESLEFQSAIAASAKNRIANYKTKMKDADPEGRRRAKKAIDTINAKMKAEKR